MTPRLVLVSPRYWPLMDEAGEVVAALAEGLAERGAQVTVLTARRARTWPAEFKRRGVRVVRSPHLPKRGWLELRYVRWINQWLVAHAGEIDLALVSTLRYEAYAGLAAGRKAGFPVVLRAETAGLSGDCHWQLEAPFGQRVKRSCFQAAACVAPSPAVERELIAAGYPRQKIVLLPNGVATEEPHTGARHAEARAVLGDAHPAMSLYDDSPLVVYAGALNASKALPSLIEAWTYVLEKMPRARLWLAGEGPMKEKLSRQIGELFLAGNVYMPGTFDDVSELLAGADAFVLPSLEEGSSVLLLRAMSAGLAIAASDVPGNAALVRHEQDGLLFPAENVPAMADAIVRLLEDAALAQRLGDTARARATEDFSLALTIERHWELCQELIGVTGVDRREPPAARGALGAPFGRPQPPD